jgi:alpha-glucosidase
MSGGRQTHPYYWQRHLYDKTQPEMIPFIKRLRKTVDQYPDRFMVAEIGDDFQIKTSVAYTNGPEMLHTAYNFALLGPNIYDPVKLRAIIEEYINEPGDSWPSWAFSNHDVKRVVSRWAVNDNVDERQAKMLIALLTSLKGTAFMYQGEELGLTEADIPFESLRDPFGIFLWPEDKGRDGCRTPFPWDGTTRHAGFSTADGTWLPIPEEHLQKSVAEEEKDVNSVLHFTRKFLSWRKKHPVLKSGDIQFIDVKAPALGFRRTQGDSEVFCIFNLDPKPVTFALPFACKPLDGHGMPGELQGGSTLSLPGFGGFYGTK